MSKAHKLLPFIIAHRGANRLFPENTLSALRAAKKAGAQWVECDVQLTRDCEAVIFHDATLDRMTNGSGYVSRASLSKVKSLQCGPSDQIPTLLEWLNCCLELGMNLNLEMKARSKNQAALLAELVVRDLKKSRFPLSNLLVSSFYLECLLCIKKSKDDIRLAFNAHFPVPLNTVEYLAKLHFFSLHFRHTLLNEKKVAYFHEKGFRVLAYTVNDLKTAKQLKSIGVDAIFTDNEKLYHFM